MGSSHSGPPSSYGPLTYSTRLLLGYVGSLGTLLLLLHLPLSSSVSSTQWVMPRSPERILVSEIRESSSDDAPDETGSSRADTPPQTHHHLPPTSAQPTRRDQDPGTGTARSPSPESSGGSQTAREVLSTSTTEVQNPEIVGGMGAFYLQVRYPLAARQQGIEGRLRLEFVVTREGTPRDIQVIDPLHPLTDTAAVRALRSVQFRPATHEGTPVAVRMTLPVRFRLLSDSTRRTAQSGSSSPRRE